MKTKEEIIEAVFDRLPANTKTFQLYDLSSGHATDDSGRYFLAIDIEPQGDDVIRLSFEEFDALKTYFPEAEYESKFKSQKLALTELKTIIRQFEIERWLA